MSKYLQRIPSQGSDEEELDDEEDVLVDGAVDDEEELVDGAVDEEVLVDGNG
ncbi:MAG: hypothetical protein NT138_02160 [Planctomycetales bacterium]|nr:hypothetical protein [Planctomycetales bacterium]